MSINNLTNLNYKNIKLDTNYNWKVAILPWGAIEPHGTHLPYLTDTILATDVTNTSVNKAENKDDYYKNKFMILPTLSMGVQNLGQINKKFCINFSINTQMAVLEDIVNSLMLNKVFKLVIINGHNGNDFKPIVRELSSKYGIMKIYVCDYLTTVNKVMLGKENVFGVKFPQVDDHAAFTETSLMLYLHNELVDKSELNRDTDIYDAFYDLNKTALKPMTSMWSPRHFDKYSVENRIGSLVGSSANNGEIIFNTVTDAIADDLINIATE